MIVQLNNHLESLQLTIPPVTVLPLRLIGISLTQITREEAIQLTLFPDEQKEKARKMDKAVDAIRSRFGSELIQRGMSDQSFNVGKKYKAQLENRSGKDGK